MDPFLPIRQLGRQNRYLSSNPYSVGVSSRWWLMCLLVIGLSSVGWGQCFNTTTLPVGNAPISLVIADFNSDGRPDLATANAISNDVSVILSTGSGSFGATTPFPVGTNPRSFAVGDFNGDGRPDLVVLILNNVSVLLGNGSGGFGAATSFPTDIGAFSIVVGDFNGDGRLDLATANTNSNTVSVLLGNGSGGFGASTNFAAGNDPGSIAVGDFNGDGRPDLTVANNAFNTVSVLLGNGSGGFGAATPFPTDINPGSVAVGDFNGDGQLDLATANFTFNTVSVLLGTGSGSFAPPTNFPVGGFPRSIAVGDFNGDGRPDLTVANDVFNAVTVLINCTTPPPPPTSPFSITGVTTVSCATVTAGERQLTFTPQYAGVTGQPISFSVVNEMLPTTSPGPYTLRLYTDNPTIILKATQTSSPSEASFNYNWLAVCGAASPPTSPFSITGVTTVSCATVTASERQLTFTPQYAGLNGQPISFSVVNEMLPTTSPGPYTLRLYTDNPTITLKATQSGTPDEASFSYNWVAVCGAGSPRLGVSLETTTRLQVKLLGNPVREAIEVDVVGGENRPLHLSLTDLRGRIIGERHTERASASEHYRFDVSSLPPGTLFLKTTQDEAQTVRVLNVN